MKIMFTVSLFIVLNLLIARPGLCDDYSQAESSVNSVYSAASKASTANTDYDARTRARDTVSAAQEATNAAIDAGAYNAADDTSAALDYSRKAATAATAADARFYSTQAEKAAANAQADIGYDRSMKKGSSGRSSGAYTGIASPSDYISDSDYDSETSSSEY